MTSVLINKKLYEYFQFIFLKIKIYLINRVKTH